MKKAFAASGVRFYISLIISSILEPIRPVSFFFFFNNPAPTEIYPFPQPAPLPIFRPPRLPPARDCGRKTGSGPPHPSPYPDPRPSSAFPRRGPHDLAALGGRRQSRLDSGARRR